MSSQQASPAVPLEATRREWGELRFDKKEYGPLDEVKVSIRAPARGAKRFRLEWYDGLGGQYGETSGRMSKGRATCSFLAGGFPGMQFARLWFDPGVRRRRAVGISEPAFVRGWFEDISAHDRLANFSLRAETRFQCGDADLDALFPLSRASMLLNRRRFRLPGKNTAGCTPAESSLPGDRPGAHETIGYTTADSGNALDLWLRDHFYNSLGFVLWEADVKSGIEAIFERQGVDGSLPDNVDAQGKTSRMNTESDVEYLGVLALYSAWMVTGDDAWLRRNLPAVEQGIAYLTSSPKRWDERTRLVRRGHTCDTWDFDIDLSDEWDEDSPAVAAVCDQSGLYLALKCLAEIHTCLGRKSKASHYGKRAREFRERAVRALWDGEKFQHHLHLDAFDHGSFDESGQLAMGNGWAMTRGLADRRQCRRILETYRRRWRKTGHRFPWWSLEPPYPVELGKCLEACRYYLCPGGYANGGMMPFVGAALALAAFEAGEEKFGARLLRDYAGFLRSENGEIYTWYWPNMEPGFRCGTRNTTCHDGWGMGHWVEAFVRGLVGVRLTGPGLASVEISPRWPALGCARIEAVAHYPSSDRYVAYRWEKGRGRIRLLVTGAARTVRLRILVPARSRAARVTLNGRGVPLRLERVGTSRYVSLSLKGPGVNEVQVALGKGAA